MSSAPRSASRRGARRAEERSNGPAEAGVERGERRARAAIAAFVILGVALRLLTVPAVGFQVDVSSAVAWAERVATVGPGAFYEAGYHHSGYQPGILYVLGALGALLDGEALRLSLKALSIPADVAIVLIVSAFAWRRAGPAAGATAAALWSFAPAAIFAGPYWGQLDSVGSLAFLGALLAAGARRWALAGALAAVATMVKPQFGLAAIVVGAAAAFELVRAGGWRPFARVSLAGLVTVIALALPFRQDPFGLLGLVLEASELYPYTSLYAFNHWSVLADFWKPDDAYVGIGAALLVAGVAASCAPLWWRRDTAMLLAAGALASAAFYFLPTRSHERYLFPAFVLLLPLAAMRARLLVPYIVLQFTFFVTLYFALSRYPMNGLRAPAWIEATLFSRPGQIALALVLIGGFAYVVWLLARGEARLAPTIQSAETAPAIGGRRPWLLPAGLGPGRAPTRRDIAVALLVALAVLATRGFRLDHPREMYFDEVYHARTAFELLAQREPYEWTHPHLAKEIMAIGILLFGGDRVVGEEEGPSGATAFAVSNEGLRAYGMPDGAIELRDRGGTAARRIAHLDGAVRQLSFDGASLLYAVTDRSVAEIAVGAGAAPRTREIAGPATSFAASRGRAIVGTPSGAQIYTLAGNAPPVVASIPITALTAKPDGSEVYVVDPLGVIHVIDPVGGQETARPIAGGAPASAIAYSRAADRIFTARAGEAALDWYEPPRAEGGARREGTYIGRIPLANGRTGDLHGPIQVLAIVPRTGSLYALTDGKAVVVETVGGSPYAAIRIGGLITGTGGLGPALGVDGTADKLLVAQLGHAQLGSPLFAPKAGVSLIETGRHALAWRLPGILFAAILAFVLVLLARRLFASEILPVLVGVAVILDGSMFAQARIGMNDVYVGTLIVVGWYFVVAAHRPRRSAALDLVVAGAAFGLALATKWVAAYAIAGVGVAALAATARAYERGRPGTGGPLDLLSPVRLAPRVARLIPERLRRFAASEDGVLSARIPLRAAFLALCFGAIPLAIYLASYVRWFGGPTAPYGWDLVELTRQMYWYHSSLTAPHAAGSPWWSWPLVLKPVYWYLGQSSGNDNAYIYDTGNIVLYWAGIAAIAWCAVAAVRARSVALGFVVFALLTQYVAWIPISRVLFFYHFFTALPFYLLGLAAALAALWESGRLTLVAGFLALAAGVFVFFYPFVSGQPVASDQAAMFFILPTWQYGCQFYPSFTCAVGPAGDVPLAALAGRLALAAGAAALAALAFALARDDPRRRLRAIVAGRGWRLLQG